MTSWLYEKYMWLLVIIICAQKRKDSRLLSVVKWSCTQFVNFSIFYCYHSTICRMQSTKYWSKEKVARSYARCCLKAQRAHQRRTGSSRGNRLFCFEMNNCCSFLKIISGHRKSVVWAMGLTPPLLCSSKNGPVLWWEVHNANYSQHTLSYLIEDPREYKTRRTEGQKGSKLRTRPLCIVVLWLL